jgi:16S rRNA (guanine1516-N2)-methyltransferase
LATHAIRNYAIAAIVNPSFRLQERGGALELLAEHRPGYGAIAIDWLGNEQRRRIAGGRRQPLARASGLQKKPDLTLLDATAGLGRDGYVLAALGARVTLVERQPLIAALLRDARRRALADPRHAAIAQRIDIVEGEALPLLDGARNWDVIFLDPMYPEDGKTALPSKEMQILRDLNRGDLDADALLAPALDCARLRVVVKRPLHAPWLAARQPSLSLKTTQVRFDIYLRSGGAVCNGRPCCSPGHSPDLREKKRKRRPQAPQGLSHLNPANDRCRY